MAKYSVSYDNGVKKEILVFRGETFDMTHVPDNLGTTSDKECFNYQLADKFDDLDADELEEITDNLDTVFEDELFMALESLEELES